ncbi:hypothetical protein HK102_013795 [Quaeritorhiza haematococci]|nr:hypothetical protein HK102_013795 [Quaeritorhiza haematococci]
MRVLPRPTDGTAPPPPPPTEIPLIPLNPPTSTVAAVVPTESSTPATTPGDGINNVQEQPSASNNNTNIAWATGVWGQKPSATDSTTNPGRNNIASGSDSSSSGSEGTNRSPGLAPWAIVVIGIGCLLLSFAAFLLYRRSLKTSTSGSTSPKGFAFHSHNSTQDPPLKDPTQKSSASNSSRPNYWSTGAPPPTKIHDDKRTSMFSANGSGIVHLAALNSDRASRVTTTRDRSTINTIRGADTFTIHTVRGATSVVADSEFQRDMEMMLQSDPVAPSVPTFILESGSSSIASESVMSRYYNDSGNGPVVIGSERTF